MEKGEILEYYIKSKTALRYWLLGRNYIKAVEAMDYALKYHNGFRKDKITPEFQHQVYIANFVRVYEPLLTYPEETFVTIFLHDVMEDYNISVEEISNIFGSIVSESVYKVSKIYKGSKKDTVFYFNEISKCPISSIVKGADRVHNINSILGVFSDTGIKNYLEETEKYIIPMLRNSRHSFYKQEAVYENLKQYLVLAINITRFGRKK